jgi:hypothetical protein
MHTLGHPATGHGGRAHAGAVDGLFAASYPDLPVADAVPVAGHADPMAGTHATARPAPDGTARAPMRGGHGMDPSLMCLAVLTALLALAAAVAPSVRRAAGVGPAAPTGARGLRSRGPPGVGVTLATLSVLRI